MLLRQALRHEPLGQDARQAFTSERAQEMNAHGVKWPRFVTQRKRQQGRQQKEIPTCGEGWADITVKIRATRRGD